MNDPLQVLLHPTDNEKLSLTLQAGRRSSPLSALASLVALPLTRDIWTPQARQRSRQSAPTPLVAECLRQCVAAPAKHDRQRHKRQLIGFLQLDGHSASDARTLADRMIAERRKSA